MSNPLSFTTAASRKVTAADKIPFTVDGVEFKLVPPKTAALGLMLVSMENAEQLVAAGKQREAAGDLMRAVSQLLKHVEQPGRTAIEARLMDPADSLDLEVFLPMMRDIVAAVGGARPTKPRRARSSEPPASGRSSRGRTR